MTRGVQSSPGISPSLGRYIISGCLVIGAGLLAGCARTPPPSENEIAFRKLAAQYGQFVARNKGQTPPNEKALKDFIKQNAGVAPEEVDKMFISSRDNQPYVIIYGQKMGAPGGNTSQVIAYEQTGVSGKRMVALATTQIEEVDETRFLELVPKGP